MRWSAAAALLCLSAGAQAEELCGVGEARSGKLEARLLVSKEGKAPPRVTYMHVASRSADGAYRLTVHYLPTESGLGIPTMAYVDIYMPVPDPDRAQDERIEWRAGSGAWFNPGYWGTPRRIGSDPKDMKGSVHYTLAQGRVHPYRTELLATFEAGVRWEFRRLDRNGGPIGEGAVDYPNSRVISGLHDRMRAQAVANLRPCGGYGPPMTASPAPPPSRPAAPVPEPAPPADPAAADAFACTYLREQEAIVAEKISRTAGPSKVAEQKVDCERRTVTRVYEVQSFRKAGERELAALQATGNKLWCSSPLFRKMIGRGWTFRVEMRGPGGGSGIGATTRKCP